MTNDKEPRSMGSASLTHPTLDVLRLLFRVWNSSRVKFFGVARSVLLVILGACFMAKLANGAVIGTF